MIDLFEDVQIEGYHFYDVEPSVIVSPAIVIRDFSIEYGDTGGGAYVVEFTATVAIAKPEDARTRRAIREAIDPTNVPAAFEAYGFTPVRALRPRAEVVGGIDCLTVDITFNTIEA
ncbi:MAG: hypothetical protein KDB40_11005 [Acidimicrobiales bacterium]|nr:hypothetical protein [Acidimicrobiales bacterium]MCB9393807.1 hypothetical protein [Acidimicrobiaceae bacterium]